MIRIKYVSTASLFVPDKDIADIVSVADYQNQRNEITGILAFNGTNFVQVLEGPYPTVKETLGRIVMDTRHTGLIVVSNEKTSEREFEGWGMKWVQGLDFDAVFQKIPKTIQFKSSATRSGAVDAR